MLSASTIARKPAGTRDRVTRAATRYHEILGWTVIPTGPDQKPIILRWQHLQTSGKIKSCVYYRLAERYDCSATDSRQVSPAQ